MNAVQVTQKIMETVKEKTDIESIEAMALLMPAIAVSLAKLADAAEIIAQDLHKIERKLK